MKPNFPLIAVALVILNPIGGSTLCAEPNGDDSDRRLEGVSSSDGRLATETMNYEKRHFDKLVDTLVTVVDSEREPMILDSAVGMLGEMRAVKAVPVLLKHLTTIRPVVALGRNEDREIGQYPCAIALVQIGNPAVPIMIDVLNSKSPSSENDFEIYGFILKKILGRDEALRQLRATLDKLPDFNRAQVQKVIAVISPTGS